MKSLVKDFGQFTSLQIFLVIADIFSFIFAKFYDNIKTNILDPILDPYFPEDRLNNMKIHLPIFIKSEIYYGRFLFNLFKNIIFLYLIFVLYKYVRKYRNKKN